MWHGPWLAMLAMDMVDMLRETDGVVGASVSAQELVTSGPRNLWPWLGPDTAAARPGLISKSRLFWECALPGESLSSSSGMWKLTRDERTVGDWFPWAARMEDPCFLLNTFDGNCATVETDFGVKVSSEAPSTLRLSLSMLDKAFTTPDDRFCTKAVDALNSWLAAAILARKVAVRIQSDS